MASYTGGCHCGGVRFEVALDGDPREVLDCNCSICTKQGCLHLIVPDAALRITRGTPAVYSFGTHVAQHMFCSACGIQPFYRPRSHPDAWDVNVRCLDGVPLTHWRIRPFDGEHWEAAREALAAPAREMAEACDARALLEHMAHNNRWANHRLHAAVAQLDTAAYRAPRTSFFPSLHLTLAHVLYVDLYYVASLEGDPVDVGHWSENDRFDATGAFAELRERQRDVDRRLVAVTASSAALHVTVELARATGRQVESRARVLMHLFQHQIHHRGQVHAMLAGTPVAPPQLDDFFLAGDLPLRVAELRELGLTER